MGRRAGISDSERQLRHVFADALSKAIGDNRGAQSMAAEKLGISRQAVSLYLKAKATPGPDILRRACDIWSLSLQVGRTNLNKDSFPSPSALKSEPMQLSLFSALAAVDDRHVTVNLLKKSASSIDLKVSIEFVEKSRTA